MGWLRRIGDLFSPSGGPPPDESTEPDRSSGPGPAAVERAAPGVAALFGAVEEGGDHAVLDLGPATGSSLEVYHRFAGHVRFADLLGEGAERGLAAALEALPSRGDRPYDMVFAWDTLDRLRPMERSRLVRRLTEITAPDARLHLVVDTSEENERSPPLRFTLLDEGRVRCEPAGQARLRRDRLLPADVEQMLAPFRVVRGFTLKGGLREYVAERGDRPTDRGAAGRP